jgi:CRISPR-associated protein Csb2
MMFLLLTVRFVDDRYHGLLGRKGPREWPPSPFRLFCAMVAGGARRGELEGDIGKALAWLQKLDPPIIIAPRAKNGQAIVRFVPNNDGDKKPDRQERLTAKHTLPTLMLDKPNVHYLWDISDEEEPPIAAIRDAARNLTSLGWGVDMAFADAKPITEPQAQKLTGVRWHPKPKVWRDEGMLRVPVVDADLQECTLCDLKHCHETAMARIEHGEPLHTVDKPRVFERVFYASVERSIGRPYRVFELHNADGSRFRYPHGRLIHLAGMIRHLAKEAMLISPPDGVDGGWVETYIVGHVKEDQQEHRQLSYLPLPSVGFQYTDPGVRRIVIAAPLGDDDQLEHVARHLAGQQLEPLRGDEFGDSEPPFLVPIKGDNVSRCYTESAHTWHSFTPVILPGHDDHKPEKTRKLIEKALAQSGVDQPCEFEWSAFSHFPKSFSAHKYDRNRRPTGYLRPDHLLSQTAVHLTLRFKDNVKVPGPIAIGAGRHCGLGLFASVESS